MPSWHLAKRRCLIDSVTVQSFSDPVVRGVALQRLYELHKQRDSTQLSVDDHLVLTTMKHLDEEK